MPFFAILWRRNEYNLASGRISGNIIFSKAVNLQDGSVYAGARKAPKLSTRLQRLLFFNFWTTNPTVFCFESFALQTCKCKALRRRT